MDDVTNRQRLVIRVVLVPADLIGDAQPDSASCGCPAVEFRYRAALLGSRSRSALAEALAGSSASASMPGHRLVTPAGNRKTTVVPCPARRIDIHRGSLQGGEAFRWP